MNKKAAVKQVEREQTDTATRPRHNKTFSPASNDNDITKDDYLTPQFTNQNNENDLVNQLENVIDLVLNQEDSLINSEGLTISLSGNNNNSGDVAQKVAGSGRQREKDLILYVLSSSLSECCESNILDWRRNKNLSPSLTTNTNNNPLTPLNSSVIPWLKSAVRKSGLLLIEDQPISQPQQRVLWFMVTRGEGISMGGNSIISHDQGKAILRAWNLAISSHIGQQESRLKKKGSGSSSSSFSLVLLIPVDFPFFLNQRYIGSCVNHRATTSSFYDCRFFELDREMLINTGSSFLVKKSSLSTLISGNWLEKGFWKETLFKSTAIKTCSYYESAITMKDLLPSCSNSSLIDLIVRDALIPARIGKRNLSIGSLSLCDDFSCSGRIRVSLNIPYLAASNINHRQLILCEHLLPRLKSLFSPPNPTPSRSSNLRRNTVNFLQKQGMIKANNNRNNHNVSLLSDNWKAWIREQVKEIFMQKDLLATDNNDNDNEQHDDSELFSLFKSIHLARIKQQRTSPKLSLASYFFA